jgi:hypothetical protein
MVPGLEERLIGGSDDEAVVVAELVSISIYVYEFILTAV